MKYNKIWNEFYEGCRETWSEHDYEYHSYMIIKHILSELPVPKTGKLIQLGTSMGISIEFLCNKYGEDRVVGYDLFNPLKHPNIVIRDLEENFLEDFEISYCDIDVGMIDNKYDLRKKYLNWAKRNLVLGGYILVNKVLVGKLSKKYKEIDLASFDNHMIWKNPHKNRIFKKVLITRVI
jgi:hypothetical protein